MFDTQNARALLTEAAAQFRFYEQNHRAKGTPDADVKAEVNNQMAARIENLLAQPDLTLEVLAVARTCHEVNRVWCIYNNDDSQPIWDEAPDWQKESAINGVLFHLTNPGAGEEASHDNWMEEKIKDGWIYGPEKIPELKRHNCLVPFNELPLAQQFKDRLFRTIVHAALNLG